MIYNFFEKFKSKNLAPFLLIFPLAVYFFFGFQHLTKFETADEHYWLYSNNVQNNYWQQNNGRIQQYWSAIATQKWEKTRINDKPGITLAYVSGIGAFFKTNLEAKLFSGELAPLSKIDKAEKVNFYFRFPLLVFNGLFMVGLFYLLKKMFRSDWVALLACSSMLLSPIVVGISQIVNPDSLLWEFGFAALLAFLIYLRDQGKKFLFVAALFLGLSLLTKYSSVIFFPFFLAVFLLYLVINQKELSRAEGFKKIAALATGLYAIFFGALLIYALIMPDNLVNYKHFLKGSIGFGGMQFFFLGIFLLNGAVLVDALRFKSKLFLGLAKELTFLVESCLKLIILLPAIIFLIVLVNSSLGLDWLGLFKVPFDASKYQFFERSPWQLITLRQFTPLVFSLSPLILLAFIYASFKNFKKDAQFHWFTAVGNAFILFYILGISLEQVSLTIRYGILLYPIVITLASLGIFQFFSNYAGKRKILALMCVVIFSAGVASLWLAKPFYFNYTNFLLPEKYLIADGWGYGGYEAASYLNSLPNVQTMRVWADYNGVCVFFNGNCSANKLTMQNIRDEAEKAGKLAPFEYFVSNRRGYILSYRLWDSLLDEYNSKEVFKIEIGKRPENFMKVFKNN
jgi:4-amino-4-deoxy-L-arabinose transferase-like glycosyltransferase